MNNISLDWIYLIVRLLNYVGENSILVTCCKLDD